MVDASRPRDPPPGVDAGHRPPETLVKRDLLNIAAVVGAVLVLAVGGPWIAREVRVLARQAPLAARADQRIATLAVSGMTCSGCAAAVEKKLAATPGVATASVRHPENRAYVVCERDVADSTLVAVVRNAGKGFDAAPVAGR